MPDVATKTLLIGWDAADWDLLEPLLDAGELPNLEALIAAGLLGRFPLFPPLDAAALWNSLATGCAPDVHGVLAHPATAAERRLPDLAERFAAAGRLAISVGWPASHAAPERENLLRVSDRFDAAFPASAGEAWLLPEGAVRPVRLAEDVARLRMHPGEFARQDLAPLIAGLEAGEPTERDGKIAAHLAASIGRQAVATYLMDNHDWRFASVFFPGIRGVIRECFEFHPPRLPQVSEPDFERYRRAVTETLKLHDQMLNRLVALAGPKANILLCALRGVTKTAARPSPQPGEHVETAPFFRPEGFCVLRGPGLRPDELLHGAGLHDLAPTLLWLAGLPLPAGLPGRPLAQAAKVPGDFAPPRQATDAAPEPLHTLPDTENPERRLHLAICRMNAGQPGDALPLLESLSRELPGRLGPALYRINCLRALGRPAEARAVLDEQAARPEGGLRPRPGLRARFFPQYDFMRGLLELDEGRPETALPHFRTALENAPENAGIHLNTARAFLALRQREDAERALRAALVIDPDEADAHFHLARLLYKSRRFREALQPALEAAMRRPMFPQVHLLLGYSLARNGQDAEAMTSLHRALTRSPGLRPAHRLLAFLHRKIPGHEQIAALHHQSGRKT